MDTLKMKEQEFNKLYPIGTPVMYVDDLGIGTKTKILSEAWDLCGTLVVKLEGKTGGYDISRILSVPKILSEKEWEAAISSSCRD